jgi:hypothetical protein
MYERRKQRTPQNTVLLEKLIVFQIVKNFPEEFSAVFTKASDWFLFQDKEI